MQVTSYMGSLNLCVTLSVHNTSFNVQTCHLYVNNNKKKA